MTSAVPARRRKSTRARNRGVNGSKRSWSVYWIRTFGRRSMAHSNCQRRGVGWDISGLGRGTRYQFLVVPIRQVLGAYGQARIVLPPRRCGAIYWSQVANSTSAGFRRVSLTRPSSGVRIGGQTKRRVEWSTGCKRPKVSVLHSPVLENHRGIHCREIPRWRLQLSLGGEIGYRPQEVSFACVGIV